MKILISNDGPTAFYYIRMGWARALMAAGHQVVLWDCKQKPAMDAFDEFEPDLFLGQTYNCTRSVCNAIRERPHMKVIMKAGDWGSLAEQIPQDEFGVLMASKTEQEMITELYEETGRPNYVHIYYHPHFLDSTHGYWRDAGIPIHSHMLGADVFDYTNGRSDDKFKSDLTFIGGYWPYKAQNIDDYLLTLCNDPKYRIKIFGNSHWPVVQYCGFAPMDKAKDILASATICPQLHEPHSTTYGFDMSERTFKLLANKCFCISDYVAGLDYLFSEDECLVLTKSRGEFQERVDYFLANPHDRQGFINRGYNKVMNEHTYFHRVAEMFVNLGMQRYADEVLKVYAVIRRDVDEGNIVQPVGR